MILNSPYISGSLTVTGNITACGGVTISGSIASASYASNTTFLNGLGSEQFVPTGSFNTFSSSILTYTGSANSRLGSIETVTGSNITRLGALEVTSGSNITRLGALETASGSAITRLSALEVTSGSNITRLSSLESKTGSYATTGSNTFDGGAYFSSSFNPTGFSTTASLYTDGGLRVTRDAYISGTLYLNNVTVYGTQSVCYITSSQLNIASNLITVNTATPSVQFGGLAVYDSGSTGLTGSILWDSQNNHWVYSNPSGSSYSGGMFISGPRTSTLGSETGTTSCMLLAGQGGDHLTSSMIYHDSAVTCIPNTLIGGVACFTTSCAASIIGGTITGTTIYGSTAVCSPVGKFSTCLDLGGALTGTSATFSGDITSRTSLNAYTLSNIEPYVFLARNSGTNGVGVIRTLDGGALAFDNGATGAAQSTKLTITAAGIATFASTVCSPTLLTNTISLGGNAVCPTNAGLGYGMFGYSGIGLGIASSANGPNQGIGFFVCGDVERMRIITSGNVGIGTVCPSYLLDVYGTGRFNSTLAITMGASTADGLFISRTSSTANGMIKFNSASADKWIVGLRNTSDDDFHIYSYAVSTDIFKLASTGAATFSSNTTVCGVLNIGGATNTYSVIQRPTAPAGSQGIILTAGAGKTEGGSGITFSDNACSGGTIWLSGNSSDIYGGGVNLIAYGQTAAANIISFATRSGNGTTTERMQITSAGKVVVGNPAYAGTTTDLSIAGDKVNSDGYYSRLMFQNSNQSGGSSASIRGERISSNYNTELTFFTANSQGDGSERMRITSGGQTQFIHSTSELDILYARNGSASPYGMNITFTAASPNNGSNNFLYLADSTTLRFAVRSNGGLSNFSGNNVNLASDRRLKKDISPLSTEWNKLKQIEVVNFKYKDSTDETALYGAIAQQVQEIYPNLVIVTREATETEPEYYGLREQPFQWLTTKVLQEAMTKIETQQCTINTLKTCLGIS